ncbi:MULTISPECIES: WXG100 family type VII secretion target [unclassified Corynebacterium]|uniref:WXG100 family type VII secretion target n=1 Tax=Corynebacterium TaxID=1716 RepID=UPI00254EBEB5|nr:MULTISPECIES: WXG100 family type VII secretion target [unclassified Corynebacterium]MDK8451707.1 WXG100 family type VII secretion target [Corynebacterium sp. MSK084]MDK8466216.1 WXG100 family type VII secretion target [Corynebacterium sp. MSK130]MDK8475832.1 WXG100 family type VII secretion target [Corynebacterium sp. MSK310]MDK8490642.1 WXG100 family type VII secretion target [Corynebacterium sp. MSK175]MDK8513643.1 WXG100 family type VII secretion target [Corynebacterium sp. MSK123]
MSQTFKTQADVMVSTAGRVDNTNDEVQGELTRLQGVVDSVRGSWAGQAQVSFDNLMQRYNTSAQQLREALTSISENIRSNARNFDNVEAENTEAFSKVGGGLAL